MPEADMPADLLADERERRHGGVVIAHTLNPENLLYNIENNCRLVAPSLGISYASNVPAYGSCALIGGPEAVAALPGHGFRVFSWDTWSGRHSIVPDMVCSIRPRPVAHAEGNCLVERAQAVAKFGPKAVGRVLEYWKHPNPGAGPCDAPAAFRQIQDAFIRDAAAPGADPRDAAGDPVCDADLEGDARDACVDDYITGTLGDSDEFAKVLRAQVLGPVAEERGLGHEREPTAGDYTRDPAACHPTTPEEVVEYFTALDDFFQGRGQVPGYKPYVLGASAIPAESILAGTAAVRLVPEILDGEVRGWTKRQKQLLTDLEAAANQALCYHEVETDSGGAFEVYDGHCPQVLAKKMVAAADPAEIEPLRGGDASAEALFEEIQRTFRDYPTTYYEAKSYGFVPLSLFSQAVVPYDAAARLQRAAEQRGCPIHFLPYGEDLQSELNRAAGLYDPEGSLIVDIDDDQYVVPAEHYAALRNALFRFHEVRGDIAVNEVLSPEDHAANVNATLGAPYQEYEDLDDWWASNEDMVGERIRDGVSDAGTAEVLEEARAALGDADLSKPFAALDLDEDVTDLVHDAIAKNLAPGSKLDEQRPILDQLGPIFKWTGEQPARTALLNALPDEDAYENEIAEAILDELRNEGDASYPARFNEVAERVYVPSADDFPAFYDEENDDLISPDDLLDDLGEQSVEALKKRLNA